MLSFRLSEGAQILETRTLTATLLMFSMIVGLALPGAAAAAGERTLAVVAWDQPAASHLAALRSEGQLLAHNEDLAVVTVPATSPVGNRAVEIESLRATGAYYLFLSQDAASALFEAPAEVLYRRGHTTLLWTPAADPHLVESDATGPLGLRQSQLITRVAKPWLAAAEARAGVGPGGTAFAPEIGPIVGEVGEVDYTAVWQSLDDFETRYTHAPQNAAAVTWIFDTLASFGLQVEYDEYPQSGIKKNVIATLPGVVDATKVVYISGHLDSTSDDPMNHAPGADDDGSGTAAVIEAARVLSQHQFEYTIKFAAFNGEEQGLRGSAAYVAEVAAAGEDVLGCFNLDMIAYRGNDPAPADLIIYTNPASVSLAQVLNDAAITFLPTDLEPVIVNQSLTASDHASFWNHGYQAILGIEEQAWGADFSPWYHTQNDRIENYPTDYPTHVTKATVAAVAHMAVPLPSAVSASVTSGPSALRLHPAIPNPSLGATTLHFDLPAAQHAELSIHDVTGRRVKTLHAGTVREGRSERVWLGRDDDGNSVAAGVYWARLETAEGVTSTPVIRVR